MHFTNNLYSCNKVAKFHGKHFHLEAADANLYSSERHFWNEIVKSKEAKVYTTYLTDPKMLKYL